MIAYQGQPGAYSQLACQQVFPNRETRPCATFVDAMQQVESGQAELAMIPLENSSAGRVEEIYRLIPKMALHIIGEHFEPVNHCLLGIPGTDIKAATEVLSHPQALAQCAQNISNLGLNPVAFLDTAGAAAEVAERKHSRCVAIASSLAAELYGLEILAKDFQDLSGNTTRFIVLSHTQSLPPMEQDTHYITSVFFKGRNIPASLYKSLGGFATNGLNLVKLESYLHGVHSSQFHVDIEGHVDMPAMKLALEELNFFAEEVRILGSYPAHPSRQSRSFHD